MNDFAPPTRGRSVLRMSLAYAGLAALLLAAPRLAAQAPAAPPPAAAPAAAAPAGVVPDLAAAPAPAAPAVPAAPPSMLDPKFIMQKGGPLMYALAVMSVIGLAMVVYGFLTLTRRRIIPNEFVKDLVMMLTYHRYAEARKACEKNGSPAAAIALAGIDYVERVEEPDADMMKEVLQGEGARQASMMQTQISYIMDLAVIAPMVGLLGTVTGMLQAFNGLSMHLSGTTPMQLIDGLMNALITTVGGLIIGIPAMAFFSFFRARSTRLIGNLEVMATELLTVMVKRGRT
ncbi:MAG: MotA/TolQ/ExbB proton channel family protein [Kiritimatiellia bacterium]